MDKIITAHENYHSDGETVDFTVWGYKNDSGKLVAHREDGAAIQYWDEDGNIGDEYWYVEGTEYAPWEIEEEVEKLGYNLPTDYSDYEMPNC